MRAKILLPMFILLITPFIFISPVKAASVEPIFVEGNPTCQSLGYDYEYKVDPPNSGIYNIGSRTATVNIYDEGKYVNWASTLGMDAVLVKGGPNANAYVYDPPQESLGDTALRSPDNGPGNIPAISHISFCYDYELEIDKTVETEFERTWDWNIEKSADQTELTLAKGEQFLVNYTVNVSQTYVDSDFLVYGIITITNPAPVPATISSITDVMSGSINADVDCLITFPYILQPDATLNCTYSTSEVDGTYVGTNTATVVSTGVKGNYVEKPVSFVGANILKIDDCINVDDTLEGDLGQVCEENRTFSYSRYVGPYEVCGVYEVENIASFVTNTTQATGSDNWIINIDVPCILGCTLTQGYWKTHSTYGPAPYDDTWALVDEDTMFFESGKTYYEVLWTTPSGNAYYNLAHQYIAAVLNGKNDASIPSGVQSALNSAKALFELYTPAQIAALKGNNSIRKQFVNLAGILGSYNEGNKGVPHCDMDVQSI